jgi:predicted TIM-barrel fold metal-dependent hydrolase
LSRSFFKIRLAVGPDGKIDYTISNPETNKWVWIETTSNDFIKQNPELTTGKRIYGACMVNGHYPELSMDELQRCFSEDKDVKMIKIHPFSTYCNMKDKRMKKIFEFASDRKLVVLVHT